MALVNKATAARLIRSNALRKGLLGGSPFWRAVWLFSFLRRRWNKVSKGGEAPITFTEPLKEGQAWALVHVPEDSARGRGEGRKMLVGPRRARPRATALAGPALSAIGAKILEAPSAERVNQILGESVVEDAPPSRAQRRASRKAEKAAAKAEAAAAKVIAKDDATAARAQAKADAAAAKAAEKSSNAQAKADARDVKAAEKAAKAQARVDAREAKKQAKIDRGTAERAAKQAAADRTAAEKAAARADKDLKKTRKARKQARNDAAEVADAAEPVGDGA